MRRCVFLAVLLSLVFGLLKENNAETNPSTSAPMITKNSENNAELNASTSAPTVSSSSENNAETNPSTSAPMITKNSENNAETNPSTSAPMITKNSENNAETNPSTSAPMITKNSENNAELSTSTSAPTVSSSSETTETVVSTASTMTTPTRPVDFCSSNPCGQNFAKCISLNSTFTCQCEYGYYFNKANCYKGKVFPGVITINETYSDSVQIVNSKKYEEVFNKVGNFFKDAFKKSLQDYVETVIVKIQPQEESRVASQMRVTVTNLFLESSNANNDTVASAVQKAIENQENPSYFSAYEETPACDVFPCDTLTTECVEDPVLECKCKTDLAKTEWDKYSCSVCSKNCSAEANKYCAINKGRPTCKCMSNFIYKDGKCIPCWVGYSGENCGDNTELILIILGSVFGAVILSLVIAVSVVSLRVKHKQNPEKKSLMKSGYSNTNIPDDRPSIMFPRVQTTSGHTNPGYQPNNPYNMQSTNRGHFSGRDYDDLYEASREPRGFRMQNRY